MPQPDDPLYETEVDAARHKLQHHHFADTNPGEVDTCFDRQDLFHSCLAGVQACLSTTLTLAVAAMFCSPFQAAAQASLLLGPTCFHAVACSLEERLLEHSQLQKAHVLSVLRRQLDAEQLGSETLEIKHRILSALWNLYQEPLTSSTPTMPAAMEGWRPGCGVCLVQLWLGSTSSAHGIAILTLMSALEQGPAGCTPLPLLLVY